MDHDGSLWKAHRQWNYSSNETVNSNPVTGSLKTLFNELDSNKENKNTLKATVWENDNWSGFHVHDEMHRDSITAEQYYDLSGDCCFVRPPVIINWKWGLALLAQSLRHAAHKMVKNIVCMEKFARFSIIWYWKKHILSTGKKGWMSHLAMISNNLDCCSQQTQTNGV